MRPDKILISIIIALVIVAVSFNGIAANQKIRSANHRSGYQSTLITIEGKVLKYIPNGMIIDMGEEREIVLGLGPQWYWEAAQCKRPQPGDFIKVQALQYDISGHLLLIFQSISCGDNRTLHLRDPSDGHQLWK